MLDDNRTRWTKRWPAWRKNRNHREEKTLHLSSKTGTWKPKQTRLTKSKKMERITQEAKAQKQTLEQVAQEKKQWICNATKQARSYGSQPGNNRERTRATQPPDHNTWRLELPRHTCPPHDMDLPTSHQTVGTNNPGSKGLGPRQRQLPWKNSGRVPVGNKRSIEQQDKGRCAHGTKK